MSTFSGKIQEIPNISVDRFDENNLQSEAYFLSHCHYDHMVGLNTFRFQNNLLTKKKFLYASEISCAILKKQFPVLEDNLKVLDIYTPTTIILNVAIISVLPISAGHCPGSVMFLFQTNNSKSSILYTGDYRINKSDIRKLKAFYDTFKQVKSVEKIYLDTTFFLKSYLKFPKREESLEELCKIIKEWTEKGKNYEIKLSTSARYGYEYMFNEIYKKTGMPVHVNKDAFDFYTTIPEMDNSMTLDGNLTQIHCSCGSSYQYICDKAFNSEVRTVKISAFRWTQDNLEDGFSSNSSNMYYVCYSTHASYEEGLELIRFLKPKGVEICVKHDNPHTNLEILKLIEEALDECKPKEEAKEEIKHKLFEVAKSASEEIVERIETEKDCDDDIFRILDSPPRSTQTLIKFGKINSTTESISCSTNNMSPTNNSFIYNSLQMQSVEGNNDSLILRDKLDIVNLESFNSDGPPMKKSK